MKCHRIIRALMTCHPHWLFQTSSWKFHKPQKSQGSITSIIKMVSILSGWCLLTLLVTMFIAWGLFRPESLTSHIWKPLLSSLAAGLGRSLYWLVLYPKIFSPLRHLPTPRVSAGNVNQSAKPTADCKLQEIWTFTGNSTSLLGEHPWDFARRMD